MKIDGLSKEFQEEIRKMINDAPADQKADAIYQSVVKIAEEMNKDLINDLVAQNAKAAADEDYKKKLGLHTLSEEEKEFYEMIVKDPQQTITAKQIDILPTSVVDRTLEDVKKASDILTLVNFAPAGVSKWLTGSHTGDRKSVV